MKYRRLGESGLSVSSLCLGTMMFGGPTKEKAAQNIVDSAYDKEINFIDTADVYNKGKSERLVGKLIRKHRDSWVLASKIGNIMGELPNQKGLGRKWLLEGLDASLKRLDTDYIDLLYLHRDDLETPTEEFVETMGGLIRAGKIRYWGLSNFRAWRIAQVIGVADALNIPRPIACQPYYNAMNRMPETEILPACNALGLGVVPYSPLARGVLTGKYTPGQAPFKGSRAGRNDQRMLTTEFREESLLLAQRICTYSQDRGYSPIDFAINWVLNNALVTSVIAGPRTFTQWQSYLGALDKPFSDEDEAFMNNLVAAGHPSSPGYTDPMYPVTGRVPLTG